MSATSLQANDRLQTVGLSKVPQITVYFWIVKILTTAMGEAASDFFVHLNAPIAVICGAAAFVSSLLLQFSVPRYNAWIYWLVVAMVSVFGTMVADIIHRIGVPVSVSTLIFAGLLTAVFGVWYASERNLSVHFIHTRRREAFYWLTVFVSFAFGTAAGDWTAHSLHLGTLASGFLFMLLFAVPAIGFFKFRMNEIFAFWFAYVMTRPLGASFADWAGDPARHGGLGYGHGPVALVLTILILVFVSYLAATRLDVEKRSI